MKPQGAGPPWLRKGKDSFAMPKGNPHVPNFQVWLAEVATALTEASAYSDKAKVTWLMKACDPSSTFETLEDSGEPTLPRAWLDVGDGYPSTGQD